MTTPKPHELAAAVVPLRLAAAAGLFVTRFRGLADISPLGRGIEADVIRDRRGALVKQAAVVWDADGGAVTVMWGYSGGVIETRRFAIAVSDAGELTIVNVDVLGVAELRDIEGGRF